MSDYFEYFCPVNFPVFLVWIDNTIILADSFRRENFSCSN